MRLLAVEVFAEGDVQLGRGPEDLVPHQTTFALFGCGFGSKGHDRSTGGG